MKQYTITVRRDLQGVSAVISLIPTYPIQLTEAEGLALSRALAVVLDPAHPAEQLVVQVGGPPAPGAG